jgi:hypothetical protein
MYPPTQIRLLSFEVQGADCLIFWAHFDAKQINFSVP